MSQFLHRTFINSLLDSWLKIYAHVVQKILLCNSSNKKRIFQKNKESVSIFNYELSSAISIFFGTSLSRLVCGTLSNGHSLSTHRPSLSSPIFPCRIQGPHNTYILTTDCVDLYFCKSYKIWEESLSNCPLCLSSIVFDF